MHVCESVNETKFTGTFCVRSVREQTTIMDSNLLSLDNLEGADPTDLLRQRNRVQALRRQSVMRSRRESGTGDNLHHGHHPHRRDSAITEDSHEDDDDEGGEEEDQDDEDNALDHFTIHLCSPGLTGSIEVSCRTQGHRTGHFRDTLACYDLLAWY